MKKVLLLFFLSFSIQLYLVAATFTVTKTADTSDGTCDGDCSLREAIIAANAAGGTNTVSVPAGTYTLSLEIVLTITSNMTLDGAGASTTIIQAHAQPGMANDFKPLKITGSGLTVIVEDVTIQNGYNNNDEGGAGVYINTSGGSNVTFDRVIINQNQLTGSADDGGGLWADGNMTLNLNNCTISNNSSGDNAGGIRITCNVFNMTECIIKGNSSSDRGGGVWISNNSVSTVTGCIIQNNTATVSGGGVILSDGTHKFTNCTISSNTASTDDGGGIYDFVTGNSITLNYCTIANNSAFDKGGGIRFTAGTNNMTNCIVADNSGGTGNDIYFTSSTLSNASEADHNVVEDCAGSTCPSGPGFITTDPSLGGLGACGNGNSTYSISSGSSAENAGTPIATTDDVCGTARDVSTPEIGAFEIGSVVTVPVELIDFRVLLRNDNSVKLYWQTASEVNNEGFEIEHSLDSRIWQTVGFVSGEGTTFEKQNYSFLHRNPTRGVNYYRLKQMDYDGAFEYLNVVSIELAVDPDSYREQLAVSPNPVQSGVLNISLPAYDYENAVLQLFDYAGRLIHVQDVYEQEEVMNVADLVAGIYLLQIEIDGQQFFERVVIH